MNSPAVLVAACPTATVEGVWQRHVAARYAAQALDGRRGTGRWSTKDGFPVLYLGRPTNSVIIEAYRHLVDPVEDERILAHLEPRVLVTCTIDIPDVLDLREAAARMQLDLPFGVLRSATSDRNAYARCQAVAQVAHQIGLHGVITPAATDVGDRCALHRHPPGCQRPGRSAPDTAWDQLPADPRNAPHATSARSTIKPDVWELACCVHAEAEPGEARASYAASVRDAPGPRRRSRSSRPFADEPELLMAGRRRPGASAGREPRTAFHDDESSWWS